MSLKTKMLGSVSLVMVLVCGLLTVNLMVEGYARQRDQLNDKAEFLAQITADWVRKTPGLDTAEMPELDRRLSSSNFITGWLVVRKIDEPDGRVTLSSVSSSTRERDLSVEDEKILRDVFSQQKITAVGNRVYAPLVTEAGILGARFDLKGRDTGGFSLTSSAWTILIIMVLGMLILVLFTYLLMSQMVLRPLQGIIDASRRISEGDFSRKIPETNRKDEMGTMITAVNLMMEKIEAYHLTLKEDIKRAREKITHTERILVHAQRLSTTGTLAAGIAHEINNPLGGMINAANTLKSGKLDPAKQGEYVELIADGLSRIRVIVQKILQFRPKAVQPVPVPIREVLDRAIAFVEHKATGKGAAVHNDVPGNLPPVHGDPLELQQAFLNVLMNAVDACDQGRGEIHIRTERQGSRVSISIQDNGIGMSEEELAHCTDPFYTTKDQGEGTGLGLAVAVSIVENHHGRLNIESRKGEGTTVFLELPLHLVD